jgi:hypothetical protein
MSILSQQEKIGNADKSPDKDSHSSQSPKGDGTPAGFIETNV